MIPRTIACEDCGCEEHRVYPYYTGSHCVKCGKFRDAPIKFVTDPDKHLPESVVINSADLKGEFKIGVGINRYWALRDTLGQLSNLAAFINDSLPLAMEEELGRRLRHEKERLAGPDCQPEILAEILDNE